MILMLLLNALRNPKFDKRLPAYANQLGLQVKLLNNPRGKIHIHAARLQARTMYGRLVDIRGDILPIVKALFKFLCCYCRWILHFVLFVLQI